MTDFTFSCFYITGESGYFPAFSFPVTILSIRESIEPGGWTKREVHFQADVGADYFNGKTLADVFKVGAPAAAYVQTMRDSCLTVGAPMKGQRAKPGTVPYRRPHELRRSKNLPREY